MPVPFHVSIPDDVLEDLRARLGKVRLPVDFANDDWSYGTNTAYLRKLLEYWRDGFDWRRQEVQINAFPHYKVEIDGIPIHFILQPGQGPAPLPLVCTHGWPWTFWDWHKVVGPLSDPAAHGGDPEDAFDVVVPSLPGFGFSTPIAVPGVNWLRTADLWAKLMRDCLGYQRFAASGGDWGTNITAQLGHKHADHVIGIHTIGVAQLDLWNGERPWDVFGPLPESLSGGERDRSLALQRRFAGHVATNVLSSQTMANGIHDSPVALASCLLEKRRAWSDCGGDVEQCFPKDDLLINFTIYWATDSFASSVRYYREATLQPWKPSHDGVPVVDVPTTISVFRRDGVAVPDGRALARTFNVRQLSIHDRGGHFAPAEQPQAIVSDIRSAFRSLRGARPTLRRRVSERGLRLRRS
jgi:pimeloyl-ACP methyl ester carboxylesterase